MDVLIIDDDVSVCEGLASLLTQAGFTCDWENEPDEGLRHARDARVVLLDLRIPGVEGLELLARLLAEYPRTPVIMVSAFGTVKTAVEAMKMGAADFVLKPPEPGELLGAIGKALRAAEPEGVPSATGPELPEDVVFRDPVSRALLERLRRAAETDLTILLEGETGVGKEVLARLAWRWSARAEGAFVKINCAAIPENLLESELFGHEKGAFTGATVTKPGRVELAAGGTLFLDEVGELPAFAQAKLLGFLQDRSFERVGGLKTLRSDARLLAATNRDLEADVAAGNFRQDLFYRIGGLRVRVPPLRERREDIPALAERFLGRFAARYGRELRFDRNALEAMARHEWPGNVRELRHVVERAVALSAGPEICVQDLFATPAAGGDAGGTLAEQRKAFERKRIVEALEQTEGNRTAAAERLGMSRRMLQRKLKEFGIR